jgi:hypothetical protein
MGLIGVRLPLLLSNETTSRRIDDITFFSSIQYSINEGSLAYCIPGYLECAEL